MQNTTIEIVEKLLREKGVYDEHGGAWIIDLKKDSSKALLVSLWCAGEQAPLLVFSEVSLLFSKEKNSTHSMR